MISAPFPSDEEARLAALQHYAILDTGPEPGFDRLTQLVSRILNVPIALMSLVDQRRQWFKSMVGLQSRETDRSVAFCSHAILSKEVFVVNDATLDERFHDNPLVLNNPNLRAYAGAPLITPSGHRIGTLCALDRKPREFTADQLETLELLAASAVDALELRHARVSLMDAAVKQYMDAERLRVLMASAPLAIVTGTNNGIVTDWNPAAERMFGWTAEEAIGKFLPYVPADKQAEARQLTQELAVQREPLIVVRKRKRKDGSELLINLAVSPLLDAAGNMRGFLSFIEDATVRHRIAQSDRAAARTDHLTGLLNRRGFAEAAAAELEATERDRMPLSVVVLDIDFFKRINDQHGHDAGDRVLKHVANQLNATLRGSDYACRWGGEELLALLPCANLEAAGHIAERIRKAVAENPCDDGLTVTLSAGVSERSAGEPIEATIARADEALYEAKATGRNRVCVSDASKPAPPNAG